MKSSDKLKILTDIFRTNDEESSGPSVPPHRKKIVQKWTKDEDECLIGILETGQENKEWKAVARQLSLLTKTKLRNSSDVRQRWTRVIEPGFEKGKWSSNEDELLIKLVEIYSHNWAEIARQMKTRSDIEIKYRAEKLKL